MDGWRDQIKLLSDEWAGMGGGGVAGCVRADEVQVKGCLSWKMKGKENTVKECEK